MTNSKKAEDSSKKQAYRSLSKNIEGFQKRWNVSWDDTQVFVQFKNRLLFLIDKYLSEILLSRADWINQFAYYCGVPAPYSMSNEDILTRFSLQNNGLQKTIVHHFISNSKNITELAWYLQNLLLVIDDIPKELRTSSYALNTFAFTSEFDDLLNASPSIQIRVTKTAKGYIVYPSGAKLLDKELVNENLVWLQDYPEVLNAFEQALTIYQSGDKPKHRNLKDNLRVAVEQLLKKLLGNKKTLENQSKELIDWLEEKGAHKQVRNLYGQLLFGNFAIFQNEVAKHEDVELSDEEIEFLIYQTGVFMRLLIQLSRNSK